MTYHIIIQKLDNLEHLLMDKLCNHWLSIKEVSQYTSLSESTIRRAISKGILKCSKNTGKLLFQISWIDRWLNG